MPRGREGSWSKIKSGSKRQHPAPAPRPRAAGPSASRPVDHEQRTSSDAADGTGLSMEAVRAAGRGSWATSTSASAEAGTSRHSEQTDGLPAESSLPRPPGTAHQSEEELNGESRRRTTGMTNGSPRVNDGTPFVVLDDAAKVDWKAGGPLSNPMPIQTCCFRHSDFKRIGFWSISVGGVYDSFDPKMASPAPSMAPPPVQFARQVAIQAYGASPTAEIPAPTAEAVSTPDVAAIVQASSSSTMVAADPLAVSATRRLSPVRRVSTPTQVDAPCKEGLGGRSPSTVGVAQPIRLPPAPAQSAGTCNNPVWSTEHVMPAVIIRLDTPDPPPDPVIEPVPVATVTALWEPEAQAFWQSGAHGACDHVSAPMRNVGTENSEAEQFAGPPARWDRPDHACACSTRPAVLQQKPYTPDTQKSAQIGRDGGVFKAHTGRTVLLPLRRNPPPWFGDVHVVLVFGLTQTGPSLEEAAEWAVGAGIAGGYAGPPPILVLAVPATYNALSYGTLGRLGYVCLGFVGSASAQAFLRAARSVQAGKDSAWVASSGIQPDWREGNVVFFHPLIIKHDFEKAAISAHFAQTFPHPHPSPPASPELLRRPTHPLSAGPGASLVSIKSTTRTAGASILEARTAWQMRPTFALDQLDPSNAEAMAVPPSRPACDIIPSTESTPHFEGRQSLFEEKAESGWYDLIDL